MNQVPLRAPVELDEAEGVKFKALRLITLSGSEIVHRLDIQAVAQLFNAPHPSFHRLRYRRSTAPKVSPRPSCARARHPKSARRRPRAPRTRVRRAPA